MHKFISRSIAFSTLLLLAYYASADVKDFSCEKSRISYTLTGPANLTVQLFNPSGALVTTMFAGIQQEGKYYFDWNGKGSDGNPILNGDYSLKIGIDRKAVNDIKFGKDGFVQFGNPVDMEVDKNGDIYVLDKGIPLLKDGKNTGKFIKPLGIYKFRGDGTPVPDFYPSETNFLGLASCRNWLAISDKNIFYAAPGHKINVHEKTGVLLYSIGGWNPDPKNKNDRTCEGKRGIYGGENGGAIGSDNKIYIRNRDGNQIKVFNRSLPKGEGWLFTEYKNLPMCGGGGPSLISDGKNKLYLTSCGGKPSIGRYDARENEIVFRYKYLKPLGSVMGMALDKDMLYVAERAPISQVYQLWDNQEAFSLVYIFSDDAIKGLRDVAVSPDGKSLYLLEDGENSGKILGKARLFKYDLGYSNVLEQKVKIADGIINK